MKESQFPSRSSASHSAAGKARSSGKPSRLRRIRSLTRLVIGGIEYGIDELLSNLEVWEAEVARDHPEFEPDSEPSTQPTGQAVPAAEAAAHLVPDAVLGLSDQAGELTESQLAQVRFALIGMIFDMQDRLSAQHTTLRRVENLAWNVLDPLTRPLRTFFRRCRAGLIAWWRAASWNTSAGSSAAAAKMLTAAPLPKPPLPPPWTAISIT
jgi:hypothetical protein